MKDILKNLASSKKFWLTAASVASWAIARFGFDVPAGDIEPVMLAIGALVLGQGLADQGKAVAQIQKEEKK